jgi:hypothetical protein
VKEDRVAASTAFVSDLNWLEVSHYILVQNFTEAIQIPEVLDQNLELLSIDRRREAHALHLDFMRRLHNYLAAVKTLVDHTRAFRRRWAHDDFDRAFNARLEELLNNPVIKFVQELRNPAQHSRLPPITRVTTFEPVPPGPNTVRPVTRLVVKVKDLNDLYEWSPLALAYVRANTDRESIDVTLAVRRYQDLMDEFYAWFFKQLTITRKDLREDFDRRRQELAKLTSDST